MRTARDIIESIQESQLLPPIDQHIAVLREVIARRQALDGTHNNPGHERLLAWATDFRNRRRVTEFQDPVTLYELAIVWDELTKQNIEEFHKPTDSHLHPLNVTLATALTGRLNAQAIRGDDGSRGILFESDLVIWSSAMAELVGQLFLNPSSDALYIGHPSFPGFFNGKDEVLVKLLQCFVNTAIHGNALVCAQIVTASPTGQHKFATEQIDRGLLAFILGHEYSHLICDHHQAETRTRILMPRHLTDAAARYPNSELSTLGSAPDSEDAFMKLVYCHSSEYEADLQGEGYCLNYLKSLPAFDARIINYNTADSSSDISEAPPQFVPFLFSTIGIALFLWSIEYLEKTVRTLQFGTDGSSHTLFDTDFGMRDLLACEEHPCPLSRIFILCKHSKLFENASKMLELLFSKFWSAVYPKLQEFHEQGHRPHPKWNHAHVRLLGELLESTLI